MKNARPTEVKASALEQRRDSITDLFPETVPRRPGGQAGFVRPDLVGLVAVAAPAIVVLLAAFFGGA